MKAIILAGGEGSRLRPLSLLRPKPMLRLMGIPLLEHLVRLLADHGYTELCMTLGYLPEPIRAHFGDGAEWNVTIEYRTEKLPLGTAGSVGACRDFAKGEEVLVISGAAASTGRRAGRRPCWPAPAGTRWNTGWCWRIRTGGYGASSKSPPRTGSARTW